MCIFFNLSSISALPLPQTNCNDFFFILFRQCHCHKFIATIFFPSISAMALPQTNWNKFFSFLVWQCHCHNSIPLFFVIKERDKPNCFGQKKYCKNKNMRTFLYISPLFRQCHCRKQQIFFFPSYSNSFPHFFPFNFGNVIATNYVLFFLFLFTTL